MEYSILSPFFHTAHNFFYAFLFPIHNFFGSKKIVLDRNFQSISSSLINTFSSDITFDGTVRKSKKKFKNFTEVPWYILFTGQIYVRGIFVEYYYDVFPNNAPRILNIGIFPECSMNILRMLYVFLGRSRNTIVVFPSG